MPRDQKLLKWQYRPAVGRPLRYARRVIAMSPGEITARIESRRRGNGRFALPLWHPPGKEALSARLEGNFFFGPEGAHRILEAWGHNRPQQAKSLVETARRGLERWEIFGVPVGLSPETLRWQAGPWEGECDARWVWELNRHQFLFTFARAHLLTGEPAFARRITALLESWWKQNPFGRGVNWASALEVGMRAISWLWTLPLLLDWEEMEEGFLRRWLIWLYKHYQYLKSRLSLYTDPTNHLIGEAAALWLLSVALPDLPDREEEERRAAQILAREVERQVAPDGVGREQSMGYQRLVLDFYLQALALARRAGRSLPPVIEKRVEAMLDFAAALAARDGEVPSLGDSDDARGVPFPELSGGYFQDLLSSGAALLDRPDWNTGTPEVAVWLGGPEALGAERTASSRPASRIYPGGGYCYWQGEQAGGRLALLFDVGPLGLWPNASHGHADALSIQVQVGGRWILADPGTGTYAASDRVRDLLRGTAAHNTVTVDELDQTDALDTFKWLNPAPARLLDAHSNENYDFALAVHEGYHRLRQPVTHYRAVLFVRPPAPQAGWIIVDRLEGEGRHHCALRFHFPPDIQLRQEGPQTVLAIDPATSTGLRFFFSEVPGGDGPTVRIDRPGLWSRRFGCWEPAPVLVVERIADLPLAWFTFLAPVSGGVETQEAETAICGGSVLCRRTWAHGEERIRWTMEGTRHRFRYRRLGEQIRL